MNKIYLTILTTFVCVLKSVTTLANCVSDYDIVQKDGEFLISCSDPNANESYTYRYEGNATDYVFEDGDVFYINKYGDTNEVEAIGSKTITYDSDGHRISATEWSRSDNGYVPQEVTDIQSNATFWEKNTTTHYGTTDDDIVDQEIQYWGGTGGGEWVMTETYQGTNLIQKSGFVDDNSRFEITYGYDAKGNLVSSSEIKYDYDEDDGWIEVSRQTESYTVATPKKRIYTVEEAAAVVKPTGNTFKIRYR